jgi:hypothetical protein
MGGGETNINDAIMICPGHHHREAYPTSSA